MREIVIFLAVSVVMVGLSPAAAHIPSSCATEKTAYFEFRKEQIAFYERWRDYGSDRVADLLDMEGQEASVTLALMKCIMGID